MADDASDEPLKDLPDNPFADDDGEADARLAQALIRHGAGKAPLADVVDALAYARVLVPLLASGEERHMGKHGVEQDHVASTGVVAIELPDGRAALPVFTDVAAMSAWRPDARPVPAEGPRAALAAVSEGWSVLVINPGAETEVIPRPAVWSLAQGQAWRPAIVDGAVDSEIATAIAQAGATVEGVVRAWAEPGDSAEVAIVAIVEPGLSAAQLDEVTGALQAQFAALDIVAERVDSIQLRLTLPPD